MSAKYRNGRDTKFLLRCRFALALRLPFGFKESTKSEKKVVKPFSIHCFWHNSLRRYLSPPRMPHHYIVRCVHKRQTENYCIHFSRNWHQRHLFRSLGNSLFVVIKVFLILRLFYDIRNFIQQNFTLKFHYRFFSWKWCNRNDEKNDERNLETERKSVCLSSHIFSSWFSNTFLFIDNSAISFDLFFPIFCMSIACNIMIHVEQKSIFPNYHFAESDCEFWHTYSMERVKKKNKFFIHFIATQYKIFKHSKNFQLIFFVSLKIKLSEKT